VGYAQKPHLYVCRTVGAAQTKLSRLILEKRSKGYQQIAVEDGPTEQLDFSSLEQSEAQVIQGRLARLQQRAEVIRQYAAIAFDRNRGVFITQMGLVSVSAIAQGQQALRQVENCLSSLSGRGDQRFVTAVEAYLAVIPLKVGMTLDPYQILGTRQQVQEQVLLLDELALVLLEVREIRELIQASLGVGVIGGSDERARWLQWGAVQEPSEPVVIEEMTALGVGDERAAWSHWAPRS
jgi:hypothetical protein